MSDNKATLITAEEAAGILGVSIKTIERYWRRGTLSYKKVGRKRRCIEEEVSFLLNKKDLNSKQLKYRVAKLEYRVKKLEYELTLLLTRSGMYREHLYLDKDLLYLYKEARKEEPKKVTIGQANHWASIVETLQEEDISKLKVLTDDPYPWKHFLKKLSQYEAMLKKRRDYYKNPSAQNTFQRLEHAKTILRTRAHIVFAEEGGGITKSFNATLPEQSSGPIEI